MHFLFLWSMFRCTNEADVKASASVEGAFKLGKLHHHKLCCGLFILQFIRSNHSSRCSCFMLLDSLNIEVVNKRNAFDVQLNGTSVWDGSAMGPPRVSWICLYSSHYRRPLFTTHSFFWHIIVLLQLRLSNLKSWKELLCMIE